MFFRKAFVPFLADIDFYEDNFSVTSFTEAENVDEAYTTLHKKTQHFDIHLSLSKAYISQIVSIQKFTFLKV